MATNGTKRVTASELSLAQLRQQIRTWNNSSNDNDAVEKPSTSPPPEETPTEKRNGDNTARSTRSTDVWMHNKDPSDSDSDGEDEFLSPDQGPSGWDDKTKPSIPMTLDSIPSIDSESEVDQIKKERDELRRQLTKANSELDIAQSTYEAKIRNMTQTEQRKKELKANTQLEDQIDELAEIAREQEEKSADDAMTVGTEGAVKNTKKTREDLEDALKERDNREQRLQEEIEKLKEQALVESDKLKESQRQVQWFQKELTAMFPDGENSSVGSSETNVISNTTSAKNAPVEEESVQDSRRQKVTREESMTLSKVFDNYSSPVEKKRRVSIVEPIKETTAVQAIPEESMTLSKVFDNYTPTATSPTATSPTATSPEKLVPDNTNHSAKKETKKQDASPDPSNKHLNLLHSQRMELEQRIQQLLHEMGILRAEQKKYQKDKQRAEIQVWTLQSDLKKEQEKHQKALGKTERQLEEWKARSSSLESDLNEGRKLAEHLKARRETEQMERQEMSQKVEQLEQEKNELSENFDKRRVDFENEKGQLTREIQALESKLAGLDSDISAQHMPKDEESWKKLVLRIQHLEAERDASARTETTLRAQLKSITEQEQESKVDIATLEERIRVLQAFLDASFSVSPKEDRQRELRKEYLSSHSRTPVEEESNQNEMDDADLANSIDSESPKSAKNVENTPESNGSESDTFYDAPQKTSEKSTPLDLTPPPDSPKKPDIDEESISSDAVVHNMHSKLESEMGHLVEKRKQLRRLRAAAKERLGVGKLGLVNEQDHSERSEDFELTETEKAKAESEIRKKLEEENSRLETALETANYKKAQLEIELGDALEKVTISSMRIDKLDEEICIHQSSVEKYESEKDELRSKLLTTENEAASLKNKISEIEGEKKSLDTTLLELKESLDTKERAILKNEELHQTQLDEIKEELAKSVAVNKEDGTQSKQISDLEAKLVQVQEESKSNIEVLSKNLEGVLAERNTLESKLEETCRELEEVQASESVLRTAAQDIVEKLESIEKLSEAKELETLELEKTIDEKNQMIANVCKELEDVKASESALRAAVQDTVGKLDTIEKLSQAKELETVELENTITEKNQRIADLEESLSSNGRRLEQAAMQMSELENEIFERDQEIEKLDSKRIAIQENASKQLIEMESLLGKDGEEIDKLEEEKSKLQQLVQSQENQIEKQQGRLAEASMQLSEMESELFAKDEEIEEMELKMNAMKALDAQRSEGSEGSEASKESPGKNPEPSNQTIQNQLDRQMQNVSKLTEQNDEWQLKLEKAYEEKEELLDRVSSLQTEVTSLRKELGDSNEKIKELAASNGRLQEDLVCAAEADEKNRVRISQMEEQKEALSEELESAMDNLAELQKQNGNSKSPTMADVTESSTTTEPAARSNKRTKRETSNEELSLDELRQQMRNWKNDETNKN